MKRIAILTLAVLITTLAAGGAHAEADIGFKGAGGKLSLVIPDVEGLDNVIGFGAFVDLGTVAEVVGLQATLDFWSKSEDAGDGEVSFRDIAIGARGQYMFPVESETIKPYAGAGLSLHFFKSEVDIPSVSAGGFTFGGGSASATDTKLGLDLIGGSGFEVSENVDIVAEAMYRVVSDVGQFVISGGAVFWFGQ